MRTLILLTVLALPTLSMAQERDCTLAANRAICLATSSDRSGADLPQSDAAPAPPTDAPAPPVGTGPMPSLEAPQPSLDGAPMPGVDSAPMPPMEAPVPIIGTGPLPVTEPTMSPPVDASPQPPIDAPAPEPSPNLLLREMLAPKVTAYDAAELAARGAPDDPELRRNADLAWDRIVADCAQAGHEDVDGCMAATGLAPIAARSSDQ